MEAHPNLAKINTFEFELPIKSHWVELKFTGDELRWTSNVQASQAIQKGVRYMTKKYKVVSLFSGAMGLDLGMHGTGRFELSACVEMAPAFCDTIRANRDAGRLLSFIKFPATSLFTERGERQIAAFAESFDPNLRVALQAHRLL